MLRESLSLSLPLVLLLACKRQPPAPTAEPVTVAPITTPRSPPARSSTASPPASASARSAACTPLTWQEDGLAADTASFVGTLDESAEGNANNELEKFFFLVLDRPVCGPDGAPVPELHVYESEKNVQLKRFLHKRIKIEGDPFAQHTAHHHRPIVVAVEKAALAP